jgi:hypothetical protein
MTTTFQPDRCSVPAMKTIDQTELLERLEELIAAQEHFLLGVQHFLAGLRPGPPRPDLRVLRGDSGLEQRPVDNPGR